MSVVDEDEDEGEGEGDGDEVEDEGGAGHADGPAPEMCAMVVGVSCVSHAFGGLFGSRHLLPLSRMAVVVVSSHCLDGRGRRCVADALWQTKRRRQTRQAARRHQSRASSSRPTFTKQGSISMHPPTLFYSTKFDCH